MMDSILYGVFALAYIALIIWLLQRAEPRFVWSNVLYVLLLALVYDNGIVAIGKLIGEGDVLYYLNYMRFVLHAFITPLLVIYSIGILQEANIAWAKRTSVFLLAALYTIALIGVELATSIWGLELRPALEYGALRYESAAEEGGPPIMILLATVVMLICSVFLWLKRGWIWFFIGVIVMTAGSMISLDVPSSAITNAFELFLMTMLVLTKRWVRTHKQTNFALIQFKTL